MEPQRGEWPEAEGITALGKHPSAGVVYFVVRLQEGMEQGVVRIMDPAGRLVSEQRVASRMGVVEVPTDNLSSGLYVAGLTVDGVTAASAKFQLTR